MTRATPPATLAAAIPIPMGEPRPNILLITTDQQRGDCLGIEGHAVLQTPNLDHLARSGAWFRRAYSECPSCFPARRSLMTGMAPAAQGMVGMRAAPWRPAFTLAGALSGAGYQTQMVGKLHLGARGRRFGFQHVIHSDGLADPDDAYGRWLAQVHGRHDRDAGLAHGVDVNGWVGRPGHLPEDQTHTFWCVSRAIDFLAHQRDPDHPFFLNVSLFDPHPPLAPPAWYYDRYIGRDLPPPVVGDWCDGPDEPQRGLSTSAWRVHLDEHQMRCCRAAYYGTINFVDDQVGRLIQYMRRHGLLADTVVAFTSDHGEMLGDHHLYRKCWPYEASARVPMLLRAPSSLSLGGGVEPAAPVGLQDLTPTLLDLAGLPVPAACTGRSLLPVLRGTAPAVREVLHGEHAGQYDVQDGHHFLVAERHKYVWYSQRGTEHLFDLQADPHECNDLARQSDADQALAPWRRRLVEILKDRPEGFVDGDRLITGRAHEALLPGYEADRFYPYL